MEWILNHELLCFVGFFAVFNALVQAMESPTEQSGAGYRYIFRLGHLLSFNFQYALNAKFPQYVPAADRINARINS